MAETHVPLSPSASDEPAQDLLAWRDSESKKTHTGRSSGDGFYQTTFKRHTPANSCVQGALYKQNIFARYLTKLIKISQ